VLIRSKRSGVEVMDGWHLLEAKQRCGKANPIDLLKEGRLAAVCRVSGSEGDLVAVPHSAWVKIAVDEEKPDLLHHEKGTVLQDLRIFPVLLAPNVVDLLQNQSLAHVFMNFVVRDPEVSALGELAVAEGGQREIFKDGMAPGWFINYRWAIDTTPKELAVDIPLTHFADNPPEPSAAITAVAEVLAVRIAALRKLLASGQLRAVGTHHSSGTTGAIHRMQWLRTNQAIDVQNGDLCDYQNPKYIPIWTGILLERGNDDSRPHTTFDELLHQQESKGRGGKQTIRAEGHCKTWLAEMMRNNSQGRLKPKAALFHEAKQKWSISRRSFDRAWGVALVETGAVAWTKSGPTKTPAPETPAAK
jgi:hypothetical protein